MGKDSSRNSNYDFIRVLASMAVVFGHCSIMNWIAMPANTIDWQITNASISICRFSVQAFLMLSGALMLSREISIEKIYKKYILRLVIVYIVWSTFYFFTSCKYVNIINSIGIIIHGHYHMWYLLTAIGLYACTPIIRKIVENRRIEEYTIILLVLLSVFAPGMVEILRTIGFSVDFLSVTLDDLLISSISLYFAYYIIGHYITTYQIKNRKVLICIGIIGLALSIFGTSFLCNFTGTKTTVLSDEESIGSFLYSIPVFYILISRKPFEKGNTLVRKISKLTLGIYMIHPFIIDVLLKTGLANTINNPMLFSIICFVTVYTLSLFISWIFSRIPLLKKIV